MINGHRICERCGKVLRTSECGHDCPHGLPCRHRADWESPECVHCCPLDRQHVPVLPAIEPDSYTLLNRKRARGFSEIDRWRELLAPEKTG
jgi:hypothetical protein